MNHATHPEPFTPSSGSRVRARRSGLPGSGARKRSKGKPPARLRAAPSGRRRGPSSLWLIAIVGGSGSGKSWLADRLASALGPRAARLSLDDFYRDRSHLSPARRARLNFDHPCAIDWLRLERVLRDFGAGRPARVPSYDFATHCRRAETRVLTPRPVLLLDGLWLLRRRSLRKLLGLSVFLERPQTIGLRRRLARDRQNRARARGAILRQFRATVEPMHRRFVQPQAARATLVLRTPCTGRQFARLLAFIDKPSCPAIM